MTPEQIGADVLASRRLKTPWKVLEERHGYERTQLWRLMRQAERREMQQKTLAMQQDGGSASRPNRSLIGS